MALDNFDDIFDNTRWTDKPTRNAAKFGREKGKKSNALRKVNKQGVDNRKFLAVLRGVISFLGVLLAIAVVVGLLYWGFMVTVS